jgi:hypothetical protein
MRGADGPADFDLFDGSATMTACDAAAKQPLSPPRMSMWQSLAVRRLAAMRPQTVGVLR